MSVSDRVRDLVAPICADLGLELYDVEHTAGKVRVIVDQPGGVDLETLSVVTRLISRELDERDPVPGRYHLEVSSPGLERPLRTPDHFRRAVGASVSIRLLPGRGDDRRVLGILEEAGEDGVTVRVEDAAETTVRLPYEDIERARTTFSWGGQPKPGKGSRASARTPATTAADEEGL